MVQRQQFLVEAIKVVTWIQQYYQTLEDLPVKSQVKPGEIYRAVDAMTSERPQSVEDFLQLLDDVIIPGMTHWQHPNFHAYFPANSSVESVLAEFVTAALGAQCMIWETSPAAAELEEFVLHQLKGFLSIPDQWEGVIQDTASTATLAAILTAREKATDHTSNFKGVPQGMRIYGSINTHSSIDKAVAISGVGRDNYIKIPVDENGKMVVDALEKAILTDLQEGLKPFCVVATIGTTGTLAVDPISQIGEICRKYDIWLHVDAAYAGTALLLEEYKWMAEGLERADSFVVNPHKWMMVNFDCSLYYVREVNQLIKTFEILPEYLKTSTRGTVNDYRDWGVPLGRRFRALKLWFVIYGMGMDKIKSQLRKHISMTRDLASRLNEVDGLKINIGPILNFFAFSVDWHDKLETNNTLTKTLLDRLNASGVLFASHTTLDGIYLIRMVMGQTYLEEAHVQRAFDAITQEWMDLKQII